MSHPNVWLLTYTAESIIQHPTPHRQPKPEASSAAVAELALNDTHEEAFGPDMSRTRQEKLMHNEGGFFQKYKELVPKHEWEAFCSLITRERDYQATLFSKIFDGYLCGYWMGTGEQLDQHSDDILLIEDLDISCILALDVQFDLDPNSSSVTLVSKGQWSLVKPLSSIASLVLARRVPGIHSVAA